MCSFGELDPCSVWRETPHIARKEHHCGGCGGRIRPGEAYLSHFSIFEGDATSQACCFPCWVAREDFSREHDGNYFVPGMLAEVLGECVAEGDEGSQRWQNHLDALRERRRAA